jgi:hypothetical protein
VQVLHAAFMICTSASRGGNAAVSLQCARPTESRAGKEGTDVMNDTVEVHAEEQGELMADLGDAARITRGQGGSGSDDKRYTYN